MSVTRGIAGIDGCRGGWLVAVRHPERSAVDCFLAPDIRSVFDRLEDVGTIGIDMPLGLPDRGTRDCERLARRVLSPDRTSSVFSSPIRPILAIDDYREACEVRERHDGRRMSKQAFYIMPKIAELDAAVRTDPRLTSRVYEIHPELSFTARNGGVPMRHAKRETAGFDRRYALLARAFGQRDLDTALAQYPRRLAARDDVLDAFAVLWSAARVTTGEALRLPAEPVYDSCGIDMAIWY